MDMEGERSSIIAALLFLTLVVLAAASGCDDDAAVGVLGEEQCHPLADDDERYELITFKNKDGEEIRLLAHQRSTTGFANRSGNWFYSIRERDAGKRGRRRRLPLLPQQSNDDNRPSRGGGSRTAEGLWNTLGALVNTTAAASDPPAAAAAAAEPYFMVIGLQTSGGDKNRLVVVADQRYFSITGFAQGFSYRPRWFFRDGERHRLLPTLGSNAGSHGGGSHAEFVASNLLAALMKRGSSCC